MAAILKKHLLTFGTDAAGYQFFFLAPDGHYPTEVANACGVSQLEDDSDLQDMPITKTAELTLSPIAARKTLRVEATNGKIKYVDIVVAADKVNGLDTALQNKDHKQGKILRVLDPRKATRY